MGKARVKLSTVVEIDKGLPAISAIKVLKKEIHDHLESGPGRGWTIEVLGRDTQ